MNTSASKTDMRTLQAQVYTAYSEIDILLKQEHKAFKDALRAGRIPPDGNFETLCGDHFACSQEWMQENFRTWKLNSIPQLGGQTREQLQKTLRKLGAASKFLKAEIARWEEKEIARLKMTLSVRRAEQSYLEEKAELVALADEAKELGLSDRLARRFCVEMTLEEGNEKEHIKEYEVEVQMMRLAKALLQTSIAGSKPKLASEEEVA